MQWIRSLTVIIMSFISHNTLFKNLFMSSSKNVSSILHMLYECFEFMLIILILWLMIMLFVSCSKNKIWSSNSLNCSIMIHWNSIWMKIFWVHYSLLWNLYSDSYLNSLTMLKIFCNKIYDFDAIFSYFYDNNEWCIHISFRTIWKIESRK